MTKHYQTTNAAKRNQPDVMYVVKRTQTERRITFHGHLIGPSVNQCDLNHHNSQFCHPMAMGKKPNMPDTYIYSN